MHTTNTKLGGTMAMPDLQEWLNTAAGAVAGAVSSFLFLRRKYSKDSAGIAHDEVSTSLLKTLLAERDLAKTEAREAWAQRTEDAKRIAQLETVLEARDAQMKNMSEQLFAFRLQVRRLTQIIIRLDPTAAALLEMPADDEDEPTIPGPRSAP
jgi:chromosome segregation ATPase